MNVIAFDTETRGLDWFNKDQRAFLASWADANGEYVADLSDEAETAAFLTALAEADLIVCHNLAFDAHQLRATTGYDVLEHVCHDTDLMSRVLLPEGQGGFGTHKLKNLAKVYLSADAQEAEQDIERLAEASNIKLKSTGGYYDTWRAHPEVLEHYAAMDARYTYDLFDRFVKDLKADKNAWRCYGLEQQVAPVLIRAEERGVKIDQDAVQSLKQRYECQLRDAYDDLARDLGEGVLGGEGSEKALEDVLLSLGVPLHRKTKTGKLSTDKYALQEFEDDFPILKTLGDYRQADRFLTTYIGPMVDRDTVHPSFMQCGAWTGRMSCRRPNMQNIPKGAGKEVRAMFVPREGHSFVVCDYDAIEVRLLAHYLNDQGYKDLIDSGHDPHAWMAAQIHGGEPKDFAKGGPQDDIRSTAKNTLFAISYGAGAPRVADMNKIPRDEAKALISKIKASLPGYYRLQDRIKKKVRAYGHVTTLYGRKQPVKRDKAYVGLNAIIQGSAADIMKQGLVNAADAVAPLGGLPILVVHDEVVVEVPTENADEALERTRTALESAYDLTPSLKVTGSVVHTNYSDA